MIDEFRAVDRALFDEAIPLWHQRRQQQQQQQQQEEEANKEAIVDPLATTSPIMEEEESESSESAESPESSESSEDSGEPAASRVKELGFKEPLIGGFKEPMGFNELGSKEPFWCGGLEGAVDWLQGVSGP